ncbi:hypothetical protein EJ08DRAFT_556319, partial [Tothia fuscella]
TSSKRGLIYIPNRKYTSDDSIWTKSNSDLTWYYNYGSSPTPSLSGSQLQFVPMLWGHPDETSGTTFYDTIKALKISGQNITHVFAFNEPDGDTKTGGSSIAPDKAASIWIRELEPLRKLGIQVGAPAVTGSQRGIDWLKDFFENCKGKCNADFMPIHWYGYSPSNNFEGLAGYVGQIMGTYPKLKIWVTEYALSRVALQESQAFYNQSAAWFDKMEYFDSNITHYSWFGSFRSDVSNVGPNAAMLTQNGKLTDIGSWYLGGSATGAVPQ